LPVLKFVKIRAILEFTKFVNANTQTIQSGVVLMSISVKVMPYQLATTTVLSLLCLIPLDPSLGLQ